MRGPGDNNGEWDRGAEAEVSGVREGGTGALGSECVFYGSLAEAPSLHL